MIKERLLYIAIIVVVSLVAWNSCQKEPEVIVSDPIVVVEYKDSIRVDTIHPDPTVNEIIKEVPTFVYLKDTITKHYEDSLKTKEFTVYIYDDIIGTLKNRSFKYINFTPVIIKENKVETKIVFKDKLIYQPVTGNFIGIKPSWNYKDNTSTIGISLMRYRDNRAVMLDYNMNGFISIGYMIRF